MNALSNCAHLWYRRPDAVSDERQVRFLTKQLTRSALSACTGVAPDAWRFAVDQYGKPNVEAPTAFQHVQFSVSHTKGLVACLVSTTSAVGVDVEHLDRPIRWRDVASYFSPMEISRLQHTSDPEHQRRFLELWTLKESYAKARGLGLRIPLDGTSFEIPADQHVNVSFSEPACDDGTRWSFAVDTLEESHVIATAIAEPGVRVVWHRA